jgi:hypothetical protein
MHIITVTRKTTAKPQAIWELWKNVPERTRWGDSLERAQLRGPFQLGVRGVVRLKEQPERTFEIVDCVSLQEYTDRFFLPMGGKMDWVHTITEAEGGHEVRFDVSVNGPTSFILGPIMKKILGRELPLTVDKLVALAEKT